MNADERRWREGGAYASSRAVFGVSPNTVPAGRRKIARGDACAPQTSSICVHLRHLRINLVSLRRCETSPHLPVDRPVSEPAAPYRSAKAAR